MNREREKIRQEVFHKPKEVVHESLKEVNGIEVDPDVNPKLRAMFPPERIKRLMEKEARRYKASLEKKWRKYLEAVNR